MNSANLRLRLGDQVYQVSLVSDHQLARAVVWVVSHRDDEPWEVQRKLNDPPSPGSRRKQGGRHVMFEARFRQEHGKEAKTAK